MTVDGILLTDFIDRSAESAGQDQTTRICRLVLLFTLRKNKSIRIKENYTSKRDA